MLHVQGGIKALKGTSRLHRWRNESELWAYIGRTVESTSQRIGCELFDYNNSSYHTRNAQLEMGEHQILPVCTWTKESKKTPTFALDALARKDQFDDVIFMDKTTVQIEQYARYSLPKWSLRIVKTSSKCLWIFNLLNTNLILTKDGFLKFLM